MELSQAKEAVMKRIVTLALVLLLVGGLSAFAGGQQAAEEEPERATEEYPMTRAERGTEYGEAPALAEEVEAGNLPPVEERLPEEPIVVDVPERIGQYGGTWQTTLLGGQDNSWLVRTTDYERLFRFKPNSTEIIPNLATGYEVSDDSRVYTLSLREGVKWSDGDPFDAEDIAFWWEVMNHEDWTSQLTYYTAVDMQNLQEVEVLDRYTVRFTFAEPNALFIKNLSTRNGHLPIHFPRHFLEQYTPMYGTDGSIQAGLDEYNREDWVDLIDWLVDNGPHGTGSPDTPVLQPWMFVTRYGEGPQHRAVRNPYYYKVDPEGNQLPYIDEVLYEQLEDAEVIVLRALNGDISFQNRHIATPGNRATFLDNREQGDYRLVPNQNTGMNMITISLNLTHQDPVMREMMQNKDFRIGLSHAIDRQEIIDLVYSGQGEPWQAAPLRESPYFDEEMAKQYTEYDVELANQYLDDAGYAERDDDGYRLLPNGERISIEIEVASAQQARIDAMELVRQYWEEVGVQTNVRTMDRSLLYTRKDTNQHDAVIWGGDGGLDTIAKPRYYFPYSNESNYAPAWASWYQGAAYYDDLEPMEPPEPTKRQMELYDQIQQTPDQQDRIDLMNEIIQIAKEEFYVMGVTLPPKGYSIVKNNLRNVIPDSFTFHQFPAHINPSIWFFE
jgi:peptide/nickel transport system substrate-binding protein